MIDLLPTDTSDAAGARADASAERAGRRRANVRKAVAGGVWLVLLALYAGYTLRNDLGPLAALRALIAFLSEHRLGPLIFVALYVLRPLLLFSATLLTLAAGVLFGPVYGVLYTVIGANLGASLAYAIGALLGDDTLPAGDGGLGRYIGRMRARGFETVFLMRLLFLPYDLVNYLAGFLRVGYGAFILATVLGSIPGTISVVLAGASVGLSEGVPSFDWRVFGVSVLVFLVSLALARLLRRREAKRKDSSHA